MPVNNDAPSLGGVGGGCKERKITREGWGNAENPGFDGDDETTTCLATVKSSSSRRGTRACVCVCVAAGCRQTYFLRQIAPPSPPSSLCPLFSFLLLLFLYFLEQERSRIEFVRGHVDGPSIISTFYMSERRMDLSRARDPFLFLFVIAVILKEIGRVIRAIGSNLLCLFMMDKVKFIARYVLRIFD